MTPLLAIVAVLEPLDEPMDEPPPQAARIVIAATAATAPAVQILLFIAPVLSVAGESAVLACVPAHHIGIAPRNRER
jgi:hypothetical protein